MRLSTAPSALPVGGRPERMDGEAIFDITPAASALIESLRGLGYSPEASIADLIDNSISAGSKSVDINLQWNDGRPTIAILDDGAGMDSNMLVQAMRLGGAGSSADRSSTDLGRFGLGLKTASLSQCRRLTVVTRRDGTTSALSLDVDVVGARGWIATVPSSLPDDPFLTRLLAGAHGTVVFWTRMDPLGGLMGLDKASFFLRLEVIRAHLGMVFHRFLDGDARRVTISTNGRPVRAWDPFQRDHPSITEMRSERIRHGASIFTIKPYVLPHRDRFANEVEYEAAGGPGGWNARQGFYVYRGKRLLVSGNWLGLGGSRAWTREDSSRLARIEIDLPTDMDTDWRIDVRKSQARPPGYLHSRLTAIAGRCREQAREVFAWRGQALRPRSPSAVPEPVWIAEGGPQGRRYRINREHPAVKAVLTRSDADAKLFKGMLAIIEQAVPVEKIWLDVSDSQIAPQAALNDTEAEELAAQLAELARALPSTRPVSEQVDILLCQIPGENPGLRTHLLRILECRS